MGLLDTPFPTLKATSAISICYILLEHSTLYQHTYMCLTLPSSINIAFWKWLYISTTHHDMNFNITDFTYFPLISKLFPDFVNDTVFVRMSECQ